MIYLLYGGDDFSLEEALASMKTDVGPAELRDVNINTLDGREVNFDQLCATCHTVPFMSDKRLVIVNGLLSMFEPRVPSRAAPRSSQSGDRALGSWAGLPEYLPTVPHTTDLAFTDGRLGATNPLLVKIRPLVEVLTFPLPAGSELRAWIRRRVEHHGASIEPAAVGALADTIGADLRAIDLEIQKLFLYSRGQSIRQQDVQDLVGYIREANVFSAVDAVLEGRAEAALRLVHQLLDSGRAPAYVITMIARQLRLLLLAKELTSQGVTQAEMGKRLSLARYPLEKTLEQERRFSTERLTTFHSRLVETDLAIKTGVLDEPLALDLLIADMASGPGRR